MIVYICPNCGKQSVLWDARARSFLCCNRPCAVSFDPPLLDSLSSVDVVRALTLNHLNVVKTWFATTHACHPDLPVSVTTFTSSRTEGAEPGPERTNRAQVFPMQGEPARLVALQ